MSEALRRYIVWNMMSDPPVDVTIEQVMEYAQGQGFNPERSSVSGIVTTTRSTMKTAIDYGWVHNGQPQ